MRASHGTYILRFVQEIHLAEGQESIAIIEENSLGALACIISGTACLPQAGPGLLPVPNIAQMCLSPFHSTRLSPNRVAFDDFMLLQRAILANREFTHSVFDALLAPDQHNIVPQSWVTSAEVLAQLLSYPFQCHCGAAPIECPVCLELLKAGEMDARAALLPFLSYSVHLPLVGDQSYVPRVQARFAAPSRPIKSHFTIVAQQVIALILQ